MYLMFFVTALSIIVSVLLTMSDNHGNVVCCYVTNNVVRIHHLTYVAFISYLK